MTDEARRTAPPPLPLRLRVPAGLTEPGGQTGQLDPWRDVWPGDPDYAAAYRHAVHAYHVAGTPMPYADAQDRADALARDTLPYDGSH